MMFSEIIRELARIIELLPKKQRFAAFVVLVVATSLCVIVVSIVTLIIRWVLLYS